MEFFMFEIFVPQIPNAINTQFFIRNYIDTHSIEDHPNNKKIFDVPSTENIKCVMGSPFPVPIVFSNRKFSLFCFGWKAELFINNEQYYDLESIFIELDNSIIEYDFAIEHKSTLGYLTHVRISDILNNREIIYDRRDKTIYCSHSKFFNKNVPKRKIVVLSKNVFSKNILFKNKNNIYSRSVSYSDKYSSYLNPDKIVELSKLSKKKLYFKKNINLDDILGKIHDKWSNVLMRIPYSSFDEEKIVKEFIDDDFFIKQIEIYLMGMKNSKLSTEFVDFVNRRIAQYGYKTLRYRTNIKNLTLKDIFLDKIEMIKREMYFIQIILNDSAGYFKN